MTRDRSEESMRRYREASAALDERPSDATRAAILAAAARQVAARPQAAGAPRTPLRRRWPFAAAATVLLSSLAVMLATRTEQEMPSFQEQEAATPSQSRRSDAPRDGAMTNQAPGEPAPAAAAAPAQTEGTRESRPIEKRSGAPAGRTEGEASTGEKLRAPGAPDAAAVASKRQPFPAAPPPDPAPAAPPGGSAPAAAAVPAPAAIAPPTPAAAPPASAPATAQPPAASPRAAMAPEEASGAREAAGADRALSAERATRGAAPARSAQGDPRQEMTGNGVQHSVQRWLELIVRLRSKGRQAEADAELKRFRESYPDIEIPPAALPPAGTR